MPAKRILLALDEPVDIDQTAAQVEAWLGDLCAREQLPPPAVLALLQGLPRELRDFASARRYTEKREARDRENAKRSNPPLRMNKKIVSLLEYALSGLSFEGSGMDPRHVEAMRLFLQGCRWRVVVSLYQIHGLRGPSRYDAEWPPFEGLERGPHRRGKDLMNTMRYASHYARLQRCGVEKEHQKATAAWLVERVALPIEQAVKEMGGQV